MILIVTCTLFRFKTTTVGLRLDESVKDILPDSVFQNHYGWIETAARAALKGIAKAFQNHYGWIETQARQHYGVELFRVSKPLRLD